MTPRVIRRTNRGLVFYLYECSIQRNTSPGTVIWNPTNYFLSHTDSSWSSHAGPENVDPVPIEAM